MICPICNHTPDSPGICNCECHPPDSIAGQFKRRNGGMSALEFIGNAGICATIPQRRIERVWVSVDKKITDKLGGPMVRIGGQWFPVVEARRIHRELADVFLEISEDKNSERST